MNRLLANNIENINIITNPGPQYGSNVSSVILIKTKKNIIKGISGNLYTLFSKNNIFTGQANTNLSYLFNNGLNIFAGGNFIKDGYQQKRETHEKFGDNASQYTDTKGIYYNRSHNITSYIGTNYDFRNNSLGIRYEYSGMPNFKYWTNGSENTNINNNIENINLHYIMHDANHKHHVNAYSILSINKISKLTFNADFLSGQSITQGLTSETSVNQLDNELIQSQDTSKYHLWASKLNFESSLLNNIFNFGMEYTQTKNKQDFTITNATGNNYLNNSTNKEKQNLWALYLSYQHKINKSINVYGGIRYELTDFIYHQNNKIIEEQSKNYNDVLPNIGINWNIGKSMINFYYKSYIERPNYQSLSGNYVFVSHTLWETGNPFLRSSLKNDIGIDYSRKSLKLSATYSQNQRTIYTIYESRENQQTNIRYDANLPNFNSYSFIAYYSPSFGKWNPTFQGLLALQDLEYGTPKESYKKPIGQFYLRNRFDFPKQLSLYINGMWTTKGHYCTAYSEGTSMIELIASKSFNSGLSLKLSINDALNTLRQKKAINTNGLFYSYLRKGGTQGITLSITYNFNSNKSKYKGTEAAKSEINRL